MDEPSEHGAAVAAWMKQATDGRSAEDLVDAFELAFGRLWARAHVTLGDVTLGAILGRVLYDATEQQPQLGSMTVETTGLRCSNLRERSGELSREGLARGLGFVLVEFLTVLGSLTAEILTTALHDELRRCAMESETRRSDREDAES